MFTWVSWLETTELVFVVMKGRSIEVVGWVWRGLGLGWMDPKIGEPGMIIRSYIFVLREMSCEFHMFIVPQKIRSAPFPETNSSHLKMDGWNTSFLLGWPVFRCYVSSREGTCSFVHKNRSVISCYVLWWDFHHGCGPDIIWASKTSTNRWGIYMKKQRHPLSLLKSYPENIRKPSTPWKIFCFLKIVLIDIFIDCICFELHSWIQVHVSLPECIEVLCLCVQLAQRSCFLTTFYYCTVFLATAAADHFITCQLRSLRCLKE